MILDIFDLTIGPADDDCTLVPVRADLDWVGLARSIGVPGARVTTMEAFNDRFAKGIATPGPALIEVVL